MVSTAVDICVTPLEITKKKLFASFIIYLGVKQTFKKYYFAIIW